MLTGSRWPAGFSLLGSSGTYSSPQPRSRISISESSHWSTSPGVLPYLLQGSLVTLIVVVGAMGLGLVLGVPLAVGQVYGHPALRRVIAVYVWFFRGIPLLVFYINTKRVTPRRDHSISTYRKALLSYSSSPAPSFGEAGRSLRTEIALGISDTLVQSTSLIVSFTVASTRA